MTIEIGEKTIGMWCVELPRAMQGNLLAHMGCLPDGRIRIDMRFRWYRDDIVGQESKDLRSWFRLETSDPEQLAIEKIRDVVAAMRERLGASSTWEPLKGARSSEEYGEALGRMPGMHVGEAMTDEQADEGIRRGMRELAEAGELPPGPLEPEASNG